MQYLLLGGSKSGKSRYGEKLAFAHNKNLIYFATMIPSDEEDLLRIQKHRQQRLNYGFKTIEAVVNLSSYQILGTCALVDSVTSILNDTCYKKTCSHLEIVDDLLAIKADDCIYVSDLCFSEGMHNEYCEAWKKQLGEINQRLAKACDVVLYFNAGIPVCLKGAEKWLKV